MFIIFSILIVFFFVKVTYFLVDIYFLTYSNALEKLFYPVFNELVTGNLSSSTERFPNENHIEGLQRLLYSGAKNDMPLPKLVEKLCCELESLIVEISKQFSFQESEVQILMTSDQIVVLQCLPYYCHFDTLSSISGISHHKQKL